VHPSGEGRLAEDKRQTMAVTSFDLETLKYLIADQHTTEI